MTKTNNFILVLIMYMDGSMNIRNSYENLNDLSYESYIALYYYLNIHYLSQN